MSNTNQLAQVIARLQENISRLEATVQKNHWQKGYVANCNATIAGYKEQITKLKSDLAV